MHIEEPAIYQTADQVLARNCQIVTDQQWLQTTLQDLNIYQNAPVVLITALTASGLGLWYWNLVNDQICYHPHCLRMLGYAVEACNCYEGWEQYVHSEDLPRIRQALSEYLQGCTGVFAVELRMLTPSGEYKWILARSQVCKWDELRSPVLMAGTLQDITPEKLSQEQQQLLQSMRNSIYSGSSLESVLPHVLQQMQQILHTGKILVYRFCGDRTGEIAFESAALPSVSPNDLDISEIIAVLEDSPEQRAWKVKANLVTPILVPTRTNNQNALWGLLIAHHRCLTCQWETREMEFFQELSREIAIAIQQRQLVGQIQEKSQHLKITLAQLQRHQQHLLQNEKMANIGRLVADIANEIYHPVDFIHSNLHPLSQYAEDLVKVIELYQSYYPQPHSVVESYLQNLDLDFVKTDFLKLLWSTRSGSERIKEMLFALQNFSEADGDKIVKVNIHKGLDSILRILQHRLKARPNRQKIEVIKEFGKLPLVECYPGELNQVFLHILTNAIDALEEKINQEDAFIPQIFIRTEIINSHLSLVSICKTQDISKLLKKHKIIIHISDNGKGILPHIQRQIFTPFFTTKSVDKCQGLGLSISQQIIVEKHQGKLNCHSQFGLGTEFVIEMNTTVRQGADHRK